MIFTNVGYSILLNLSAICIMAVYFAAIIVAVQDMHSHYFACSIKLWQLKSATQQLFNKHSAVGFIIIVQAVLYLLLHNSSVPFKLKDFQLVI